MLKQYKKDIQFIESLSNLPRNNYLLGLKDRGIYLKRLKNFLSLVNNPQNDLKFIHVAGTSGKGTTTKILQALLTDAGLKTGAYTSPYATTAIEKISVGHKLISAQELHDILEEKIKPALDKYWISFKTEPISYFELWLAIALIYFKEKKCDWVILEAGLGGLHDATNIISSPKITAITNIGLDHTQILGNTKSKIAKDKAGIIKKNSIFISTEKNPKLLNIFKARCQQKQAWFIKPKNLSKDYQLSDYFFTKRQEQNLNLALNIMDVLKIDSKNTQKIIDNFKLLCRQEIVQANPLVVLDGSHNQDKINNLIDFVQEKKYRQMHLIVGFGLDKNFKSSLKKLSQLASKIYITHSLTAEKKVADPRQIYNLAKKYKNISSIHIYTDPYQALQKAQENAGKSDLILVTGSFFLAGELRKKWVSEEYIVKHRKFDK